MDVGPTMLAWPTVIRGVEIPAYTPNTVAREPLIKADFAQR
jgi:hypothetical protein